MGRWLQLEVFYFFGDFLGLDLAFAMRKSTGWPNNQP
jgi:hypothetical protein